MPPEDAEDADVRSADPIEWFELLFAEAGRGEPFDAARAALATVDEHGAPDVRFVLIKGVDERGFVFHTNYASAKAVHLSRLPRAALAFHWASTGWQVRVRGRVSRLEPDASDAYFESRPRGSQLAAWASRQSAPLSDRVTLEQRMAERARRFPPSAPVPRPEFWGGYRLEPEQVEFWHSRDNRLHDRWLFSREGPGWKRQRLQP